MKRKLSLGLLLCAACIMAAAMWGCSGETGSSIDNQGISVKEIKKISVRDGAGGIALSDGDQVDFIKMVNGFTLNEERDGSDGKEQKGYSRGYCFDLEDEQGEVHRLQFFDQRLTVDLEEDYEISQEDLEALTSYWEEHGLADMLGESHLPGEALICKAYIESHRPERQIDWSYYSVSEVREGKYTHGGFNGIKDPASADWSRYRMVCVGNPMGGDFAYLIVDIQEGKVAAEQPEQE